MSPGQGTPNPERVRVQRAPTGVSVSACASRGRPGTGSEGGPFLRAGRRRPVLRPLGPSSHLKQLCVGAAAVGAQKERPPPWLLPTPRAAHGCWGRVPDGDLCLLGDKPPLPCQLVTGTARCPPWAELCAPVGHGDSSVSLLGTASCHHQAWGQFSATLGHRGSSVSPLGTALWPL